jgi:cobalt/nickel transport system ATP-binding protein
VIDPRSGSIRLGRRNGQASPLAVVLQSPEDQLVGASVLEDVAMGPRARGASGPQAEMRAREALRQTGLDDPDLYERPPSELSHGQRRRAAWAGALASGADLWILDEPTAGLDGDGVLAFQNAMTAFLDRGG